MGMYNEVVTSCPECESGVGIGQIPQIVEGFGNFNIDDPEQLAERLKPEQILTLADYVEKADFTCEACGAGFKVENTLDREARRFLAQTLFSREARP